MKIEEQSLFMKHVGESVYCNIYKVALFTGMRAGEISALEWKDIDLKNKIINVNGTMKFIKGKGYFKIHLKLFQVIEAFRCLMVYIIF